MRRGGRILIVLGLLLGLVTALATFAMLAGQTGGEQVETRPVVIAAQNIVGRGEITAEMLVIANFPAETAPIDAFTSLSEVVGKIAIDPVYQGQVLLPKMLLTKPTAITAGNGSLASFLIPEGKVAMAFTINDVTGVAGAIQVGDAVDMLLTLDASGQASPAGGAPTPRPGATPTGNEGRVTQIFLQDVLVLNVGTWAAASPDQGSAPASILTFAIDRQSALALKNAREQGEIDLVLRRSVDRGTYDLTPVTLQYLNQKYKFNLAPPATGR